MDERPTVLHADLDAFYASVEQLLDPRLRGRALAVGGGVVLAASYEAKRVGVSSGMVGWRARERCPDLIFVKGHFSEYRRLSEQVMGILGDYTPAVERVSIDEAFLDVGGSRRLFGEPAEIAKVIRHRVAGEVGLPISVGAARTKHLAKIASQVAKPDGLVVVEPDRERAFLDPLPVQLVWGVGPATQARLAHRGITTIGELARASPDTLARLVGGGVAGKLRALANNDDWRRVRTDGRARSVGAQSALGRASPTPELLAEVLGHLADRVAGRLRAKRRAGRTVTVRVRFSGMRSITRSVTVRDPVASTLTLREIAESLVVQALSDHPVERSVTLLAISVSNLIEDPEVQLELPVPGGDRHRSGSPPAVARLAVDRSMDAVRSRFGRSAVGYAAVALSERGAVPDEFRELAEREA
ncbi:MAG: DNA polymerase IV [Thermoleophilia bacterium]|nr:DNA polymerase IV [Thermoleophilia bacterium]